MVAFTKKQVICPIYMYIVYKFKMFYNFLRYSLFILHSYDALDI